MQVMQVRATAEPVKPGKVGLREKEEPLVTAATPGTAAVVTAAVVTAVVGGTTAAKRTMAAAIP
jgi:hypothetical protein